MAEEKNGAIWPTNIVSFNEFGIRRIFSLSERVNGMCIVR